MTDDREAHKQANRARTFRRIPLYERYIADPQQVEQLAPRTRANTLMALGKYRNDRDAAAAEGIDISDPTDRSAA